MSEKVKQFAPARLTADVSKLPERERQVLGKLIEASRLLDPVFDRQAHAANPELRERLASDSTPEGRDKLAYFDIMRGPWDRQDHHRPFAIDRPRPPGAGFYPEDLSADELHAWTAQHPGDKEAFESLFTLIRRDAGRLVAMPYSQTYAAWLGPAGA
ncbi:MAG TPA: hypothetical protein VL242_45795, partial [Sorangium sp.]|nr:hypothetical protein [Sorangium sp.]